MILNIVRGSGLTDSVAMGPEAVTTGCLSFHLNEWFSISRNVLSYHKLYDKIDTTLISALKMKQGLLLSMKTLCSGNKLALGLFKVRIIHIAAQ